MATFQLTVILGAAAGQSFAVPDSGATVGRSRMADIQLADGGLSRLHCRVFCENGVGMVQDLGSSNGTTVNGVAIGSEPFRIAEGDCIAVGETALRLSRCTAAAAAPAVSAPPPPEPVAPPQIPVVPFAQDLPEASVTVLPPPPPAPPSPPALSAEIPLQAPDLFGAAPADAPAASDLAGSVDLGLSPKTEGGDKRRPSSLTGLIFALAAILVLLIGAGAIFVLGERANEQPAAVRTLPSTAGEPFEFRYERLWITDRTLFRYTLAYSASGVLSLSIDDLGSADRSFKKSKMLNAAARKLLREDVTDSDYAQIREFFPERSPDGVSLKRKSLTIVMGSEIWERVAENVDHTAFDLLCERLELFGRNELGAWATQFSVSELETMGREQLEIAQRYWEQRDMGDEKLFQALTAYRKGVSALETLNPKPDFSRELTRGLREAEALLTERYEAAAFAVDQAMNTQRYDQAAEALQRILRMIPDREDERNLKATDRLLSIQNRFLRKGGR